VISFNGKIGKGNKLMGEANGIDRYYSMLSCLLSCDTLDQHSCGFEEML